MIYPIMTHYVTKTNLDDIIQETEQRMIIQSRQVNNQSNSIKKLAYELLIAYSLLISGLIGFLIVWMVVVF